MPLLAERAVLSAHAEPFITDAPKDLGTRAAAFLATKVPEPGRSGHERNVDDLVGIAADAALGGDDAALCNHTLTLKSRSASLSEVF